MIKNDSGIKSATGLTGSGSRDWIIQRISAVVLAVSGGKPVALAKVEGGEIRPVRVLNL